MDQTSYRLVFMGEVREGEEREAVQQRLASLFRKEPAKLDKLFSGGRHVLKNNLTLEQATHFSQAIERTGARVAIEPQQAATNADTNSADAVTRHFNGGIEPVRITPLYQLAMAGVTVAMLLLPLFYLALIGLTGYGVFYHAVENVGILSQHGSGSGRLLLYLTPIVIGAVLVVFMLKPFLLFRPEKHFPIALSPEREKTLFAFVHRICDAVGACYPKRIQVDNQVNASAGFYHGLHGLLRNELVLTVGIPLAAGMNQRQLAGVLAHEFGHFSQGAAMRMSYLINWVNHWLYRAVYQRDIFDYKLEQWAARGIIYTIVVLQVARFFIWLIRRLLWLLMTLGGAISSLMSRQMEFDADRHEARLAGSEQFADTSVRLITLGYAAQMVHEDQVNTWANQSRLVADFPAATVSRAGTFSEELRQQIVEGEEARKGELFDTHPPHRERVESARRENSRGIFHNEEPASALFSDFDQLAQKVTLHFYRNDLQLKVGEKNLLSLEAFEDATIRNERERNAVLQFFFEVHTIDAPNELSLPQNLEAVEQGQVIEKWREACMRQRFTLEICRQLLEDYSQVYSELSGAMMAHALLKAGFSLNAEEFDLDEASIAEAENKTESCRAEEQRLLEKLRTHGRPAYNRLQLALSLVASGPVRASQEDAGALQREVAQLVITQRRICQVIPWLLDARHRNDVLRTLLQNAEGDSSSKLIEQIAACMAGLRQSLEPIRSQLSNLPYPFEHCEEGLTISGYLFYDGELPDDPYQLNDLTDTLDDNLRSLNYRILGRLCTVALCIEDLVGVQCREEAAASL